MPRVRVRRVGPGDVDQRGVPEDGGGYGSALLLLKGRRSCGERRGGEGGAGYAGAAAGVGEVLGVHVLGARVVRVATEEDERASIAVVVVAGGAMRRVEAGRRRLRVEAGREGCPKSQLVAAVVEEMIRK